MSSINATISAVNRALGRLGRKSDLKSSSVKRMEESILREAAAMVKPDLAAAIHMSINDIWNKPATLSAADKKIRQGKMREVLSIITPHDTPLERWLDGNALDPDVAPQATMAAE